MIVVFHERVASLDGVGVGLGSTQHVLAGKEEGGHGRGEALKASTSDGCNCLMSTIPRRLIRIILRLALSLKHKNVARQTLLRAGSSTHLLSGLHPQHRVVRRAIRHVLVQAFDRPLKLFEHALSQELSPPIGKIILKISPMAETTIDRESVCGRRRATVTTTARERVQQRETTHTALVNSKGGRGDRRGVFYHDVGRACSSQALRLLLGSFSEISLVSRSEVQPWDLYVLKVQPYKISVNPHVDSGGSTKYILDALGTKGLSRTIREILPACSEAHGDSRPQSVSPFACNCSWSACTAVETLWVLCAAYFFLMNDEEGALLVLWMMRHIHTYSCHAVSCRDAFTNNHLANQGQAREDNISEAAVDAHILDSYPTTHNSQGLANFLIPSRGCPTGQPGVRPQARGTWQQV